MSNIKGTGLTVGEKKIFKDFFYEQFNKPHGRPILSLGFII